LATADLLLERQNSLLFSRDSFALLPVHGWFKGFALAVFLGKPPQLAVSGALLRRLLSLCLKCRVESFRLLEASDRMYWKLLKKLLIHLLHVQGFLDTATNAVTNHQARELVAVDENNPRAQLHGCLTSRL
jgi:hypothetical protein